MVLLKKKLEELETGRFLNKVSSKKLKNTFVNVVFWVQMGLIIASVVLVVVLVVALAAACGAMIESC